MAITTKTPIPFLFTETLIPSNNFMEGWVGDINAVSPVTSLTGADALQALQDSPSSSIRVGGLNRAYIYLYVDGFLINPPELNPDGSYKTNPLTILTDINGYWKTTAIYFGKYGLFQSGHTLTLKAKAPGMGVSDFSVPYVLGGTPTPINLGTVDSFGRVRPPQAEETSIYGSMSNWLDFRTGAPILDDKNRVFIYIDGERKGEVLKNNLVGIDAKFPIIIDVSNLTLDLLVNNKEINVPLERFDSSTIIDFKELPDGERTVFTFNLLDIASLLKVYQNGLRLKEQIDYVYTPDITTNIGTVSIISDKIPKIEDTLYGILELDTVNTKIGESLQGVVDGVNDTFTLSNTPLGNDDGTLRIFKNGLKLKRIEEYSFAMVSTIPTVTFVIPPTAEDAYQVDYQLTTAPTRAYYTVVPAQTVEDDQVFTFIRPYYSGGTSIYKNGLLLREGIDFIYTAVTDSDANSNTVAVSFNLADPATQIRVGDELSVNFDTQYISLDSLAAALSRSTLLRENSIFVSTYQYGFNDSSADLRSAVVLSNQNNIVVLPTLKYNPYPKIYKSGRRQIRNVDYTKKDTTNTITFTSSISDADSIVAVYDYNVTEFVFEEKLVNKTETTPSGYTGYKLKAYARNDSIQPYINGLRIFKDSDNFTVSTNAIFIKNGLIPNDEAILAVDYQILSSEEKLVYTSTPDTTTDGGIIASCPLPPSISGANWSFSIYANGLRLVEGKDYTTTDIITLSEAALSTTTELRIEQNVSDLTLGRAVQQLKLSSPYKLDFMELTEDRQIIYDNFFGPNRVLDPGKDIYDNSFKFYFNPKTGQWKYTHDVPFVKGQHIQAIALNETPLSLVVPSDQSIIPGTIIDDPNFYLP